METNIRIKIDSAVLAWLKENWKARPSELAATIIERFVVETGGPSPERHEVGAVEFQRCTEMALKDEGIIERVIAPRKARIARAVSEGFRTGAR